MSNKPFLSKEIMDKRRERFRLKQVKNKSGTFIEQIDLEEKEEDSFLAKLAEIKNEVAQKKFTITEDKISMEKISQKKIKKKKGSLLLKPP